MKIYINNEHQITTNSQINPLQAYLNRSRSTTDPLPDDYYEIVTSPEDADYWLLPLMWNYYINNDAIRFASKLNDEVNRAGKRLIIFSTGDYTANVPFQNPIIIQSSCFKSRDGLNGQNLLSIPTFIPDYTKMYCQGILQIRKKQPYPTIGFCGQANGSIFDYARRQMNITAKQLLYRLKVLKWEPSNIEPSKFRHDVLDQLQSNNSIRTNFVMRTKYRAGYHPKGEKDFFHPTRVEFIQNILDSDYTICMRGAGNFSVRFYETLALGRIPIFVNTDCVLPIDEIIHYKKYMVWIEQDEIPFIGRKIVDFHNSLSEKKFIDSQIACRDLWLEYLTRSEYFKHLANYLMKPHQMAA